MLACALALVACRDHGRAAGDASVARAAPDDAAAVDAAALASTVVTEGGAPLDVVAHASQLTDGGAAASDATRVVDGAALRARAHARLSEASPVTVLQGGTARDLGERLCKAVVPQRPADTPVLLKPNIGGFDWFKDPEKSGGDDGLKGRITDPEFVRGVVRCLRARGHTRITIAEGWGATHKDWEHLVQASGYAKMAAEENVPLVAMDDDGVFDVQGDQPGKPLRVTGMEATHVPTLLVPKLLADHLEQGRGLFISLPKIKAHRFGVFSMAVKGMQGTVMLSDAPPAYRQKSRMHKELNAWLRERKKDDRAAYVSALETFADRIADVLEVEAPDCVLAEGAPAMGGDGFQKLYPSAESFAVGGTNPILVDRVGAELLGLWNNEALGRELGGHTTSPLLETAAKREHLDLTSPRVVGDGAALLGKPRPVHFVAMAPFSIHSDTTPTAHAVHGEVAVDGKPDDATWARAKPVSWSTDWAGKPTSTSTRARFAWSANALYALFELEGTDLITDTSKPTDVDRARLYDEDCVEVFVGPAAQPQHYYEIEVGPYGHFLDLEIGGATPPPGVGSAPSSAANVTWSSGLRVATTRDASARHATIEIALHSPDITRMLVADATLGLGLFRMEGAKERLYLAWSPTRTPKPNFHVPETFGTLALDP